LICALFCLLEAIENLAVIVLHHFNSVSLVLIGRLVSFDLILCVFDSVFEFFLLVVELVFQGQKVLIQGNTVSQKRFIATCLVLLVDFLIFQKFDLRLHSGDLLV